MTTSSEHPMDAVSHTLLREVAAIHERAQGVQRLHHLMRPGAQHESAGHAERGGRGVPLGAVDLLPRAPRQNDPW